MIIGGAKPTIFIKDAGTLLEFDALYGTIPNNAIRPPAVVDGNALGQRGCDFLLISRHFVTFFQGNHLYMLSAEPQGRSCHVDGHIAAADDHNVFADTGLVVLIAGLFQEFHAIVDALPVFAVNTQLPAHMGAGADEDAIVFFLQCRDGFILAHAAV